MRLCALTRPIALTLGLALAAPKAQAAVLAPDEVESLAADAQRLADEGDYSGAIEKLKEAHAIDPDPVLLYAMGTVEVRRGDCNAATRYYEQVVSESTDPKLKDFAQRQIEDCADKLEPEVDPLDEPIEPVVDEEPVDDAPPPVRPARPWQRDPTGASLVAVGSATLVAGAGLFVAAGIAAKRGSTDGITHEEFDRQFKRNHTFLTAGGIVAGVGAALLIGGGVRWALVKKKQRQADDMTFGVMWHRNVVGFTAAGRF